MIKTGQFRAGLFLLSREGIDRLAGRRKQLEEIIEGHVAALSAAKRGSSEMRNFSGARPFIQSQLDIDRRLLAQITLVLENSQLLELARDTSIVWPGTVVTLEQFDGQGISLGVQTVLFGEYGATNAKTDPITVGCESLRYAHLIGRRVGECVIARIEGEDVETEILAISLPAAPAQAQVA